MELLLPGLFIFFIAAPLFLCWMAFRLGLIAHNLAKRQATPTRTYPLAKVLDETFVPDQEGVWPPPPTDT